MLVNLRFAGSTGAYVRARLVLDGSDVGELLVERVSFTQLLELLNPTGYETSPLKKSSQVKDEQDAPITTTKSIQKGGTV